MKTLINILTVLTLSSCAFNATSLRIPANEASTSCTDIIREILTSETREKNLSLEPKYTLNESERLKLASDFKTKIKFHDSLKFEKSLEKLKATIDTQSYSKLLKAIEENSNTKLVTQEDLSTLLGYIDFLEGRGINTRNMPLEIRIEGTGASAKSYFLTDVRHSLIGSVEKQEFLWTHDEGWAKERFLENKSGEYLCGQWMGTSKFVTLGKMDGDITKRQVLEKLGLIGYPKFDKPGAFYLVSAMATPERIKDLNPMVPLIYKWPGADGSWELASNFGVDTIPGFTSGGMSEVVIPTFTVKAADLTALKKQNVYIREFNDE